jgi:integrase
MAGRQRRQKGEGSVYHRKTRDQWVAIADLGWKNGQRDRREFTGKTPEKALDRRAEFLDKRRDGFTPPKGRKPYAGEWLRHWLWNIAKPRVDTRSWERCYRHLGEDIIIPFFEKIILDELDEDDIRAWHAHLQRTPSAKTGRPLSASTIGVAHRILSAALNDALRPPKRIGHNPASLVPPPTAHPEEPMPPEEEEVMALLKECEDRRTGPRWVTAIATGLRQGETLGLLWPYVDLDDLDDASIDVQWELVRLLWQHGCEDPHVCGARLHGQRCEPDCEKHAASCPLRHGGGLRLKRPKSESSRARIPLARYAALTLRQWRTDQKEERLAAGPDWRGWAHTCNRRLKPRQQVCPDCMMPARPGLLVFADQLGRPVDVKQDWLDWGELLETSGLPHYRVHDTRHGTATMLLEEGEDIRVVQEIMRHASPDFTRKTYQHVRAKLRRQAADSIDRRLSGGR